MKVRITKAGKQTYWYSNKIGDIFYVVEIEEYQEEYFPNDYEVVDEDDKRCRLMIDKDDCEIVEE